jgi:hypothetical protein
MGEPSVLESRIPSVSIRDRESDQGRGERFLETKSCRSSPSFDIVCPKASILHTCRPTAEPFGTDEEP